ncbi:MAG: hypothetical protein HYT28_02530 [Parcubacteria group bacterium]|nr:hypothetical protein [Parcubacteria group bacterium]
MKYLTGQQEREAKGWMNATAKVAKKSLCLRAQCGAVIVKNGVIIEDGICEYSTDAYNKLSYQYIHAR